MNRERRAVLRGVATAVGVGSAVGSATASGSNASGPSRTEGRSGTGGASRTDGTSRTDGVDAHRGASVERRKRAVLTRALRQQVDTTLAPGVTLFDLSGDGAYTATVEQAAPESGGGRSGAIHVTSGGNSTVDYAASVVEPPDGTTLGSLGDLTYDYYEGADNVNPDAEGGGFAPDETFLVVENADGRHGTYLTYNDAGGGGDPAEEWRTFDVLARMGGDTGGTSGWFEYTEVEEGYSGRTFGSVVERFGADARLVRVGVGHGNAVNPATLDLYYDGLTIDGESLAFPSEVVERTQ